MKLPNLISKFYIISQRIVPESVKPTVRGLYYSLAKLYYYRTLNMFAAIDIETVSKCNIKCSYCPVIKYDRGFHLMDEELYKKIIDELSNISYQGRLSPHFYGEPLLDKRLPKLLAYARQKLPKTDIIIHTNGLLLNKKLYQVFIESGVDGFVITLHNNLIRQKVNDLFKSLTAEEKQKIRLLNFSKKRLFNRGGLVEVERPKKLKRCFYIRDEIAVTYSGEIVCTNDFFARHSFGNVKNEKLLDIWNKPAFKKIRGDLLRGKFVLEICKRCAN